MSDINLIIDGTCYKLQKVDWMPQTTPFDWNTPMVKFGNEVFVGTAIPKEKDIPKDNWEVISCIGWHNLKKDTIFKKRGNLFYPDGIDDHAGYHEFYLKEYLTDIKIHSVKRLKTEVFTIGDITQYGKIDSFWIGENTNTMFAQFGNRPIDINGIEKVKPKVPVFTKEQIINFFTRKAMKGVLSHGMARKGKISPEFYTWTNMIQRCYNQKHKGFKNYGGRGITVCERWLNSFSNFLADMGVRPSNKHSLDRHPNNNGNYTQDNCRWATKRQQQNNLRINVFVFYKGENKTIAEWANELNINRDTISFRLRKKMPIDKVFFKGHLQKINP